MAAHVDGLVPVVKGNGYGFGRATLHPLIKSLSDFVCVGTVYELDGVADRVTPIVLTPSLVPPPTPSSGLTPVMTVGSVADVDALGGWHGRAIIKLQSSMRRYGATPSELEFLTVAVRTAGLDVVGYALHLPLAGTDQDRLVEVEGWLDHLDPKQPALAQPSPATVVQHTAGSPSRSSVPAAGSAPPCGTATSRSCSCRQTSSRYTESSRVTAPAISSTRLSADGHLVLVSAGSAHGVAPLAGGAQPVPLRPSPAARCSNRRTCTRRWSSSHSAIRVRRSVTVVDVQRPLITTLGRRGRVGVNRSPSTIG